MSRRNDRGPLLDMLGAATEAGEIFESATADELERDRRTHLALLHLIVLIGEAATRVSPAMREAHPEIPWRVIVGMRNWLVHAYDRVERDRVHDTVATHLPRLVSQRTAILGEE